MSTPAPHALNAPPWQRVETTMIETARSIRLAYERYFDPLGLTLSQASAIGYVNENGPMTQTQLAAALVLGKAATGSLVDQLEERGLVTRVPNPDDRRVWLVENTPAGGAMAIEIVAIDRDLRASIRTGITSDERRQLADLLLRMAANAETANAAADTANAAAETAHQPTQNATNP